MVICAHSVESLYKDTPDVAASFSTLSVCMILVQMYCMRTPPLIRTLYQSLGERFHCTMLPKLLLVHELNLVKVNKL